jgi:imidazolonepropionase-like amidohydrolase
VRRLAALGAVTVLLLAACSPARPDRAASADSTPRPSVAITHVSVVDVAAGVLLADQNVVVRDGRVVAVGAAARTAVPAGATLVNGEGKFLIPGLWDFHVHALFDAEVARSFLPRFVAEGVTGIRDMGGSLEVLRAARWALLAGTLIGPRIVAAGAVLDGPRPVAPEVSIAVADTGTARAAVDSLVRGGADFLKVYTNLPRAAYFFILREAARRHLTVAGHVPMGVSPLQAADSGQRSIEHLRDEIEPLCAEAADPACARLLDTLRVHRTALVPTLVVLRVKAILDDSSLLQDPRLSTVPGLVRDGWETARRGKAGRPPEYWRERRARFFGELALTAAAFRAGVPLLAGTDAGALYTYPGSSLHDELVQMVRAGLSPAAALRSATLGPAEFLGAADSMGTVAVGRVADLVLLDADPLADILNTRMVAAVVLRGRLYSRPALDSLAAAGAAAARPPEGRR